MENIKDFSDDRLKSICIHCGTSLSDQHINRDHVPSKSLLEKPLPAYLPQVYVCSACNTSFSFDEEYVIALLSCILSGTTEPDAQVIPSVKRAFIRRPSLQAKLEASKRVNKKSKDDLIEWQPDLERMKRVILKNARGHVYYEASESILSEPEYINMGPIALLDKNELCDFLNAEYSQIWPEVGSRLMQRLVERQDFENGWITVQENVYAYCVIQTESGISVRSIIRNYLATEVYWNNDY